MYLDLNGAVRKLVSFKVENALHSSKFGGNEYFGWNDAKRANTFELAELIKQRFPRLLLMCRQQNFEYTGWFVHMLGTCDVVGLPIFSYSKDKQAKYKNTGTWGSKSLFTPHFNELNKQNNQEWLWKSDIDVSSDWHYAHRPVIDSIKRQEIPIYPKYPSFTNCHITHASYWGGAIYYLQTVMGYNNEADYINDRINRNVLWKEFELIYNSEGQLHLLDGYLSREAIKKYKSRMTHKNLQECYNSLRDLELLYQEIPYPFPNPFFGGTNPMHLAPLKSLGSE